MWHEMENIYVIVGLKLTLKISGLPSLSGVSSSPKYIGGGLGLSTVIIWR